MQGGVEHDVLGLEVGVDDGQVQVEVVQRAQHLQIRPLHVGSRPFLNPGSHCL